MMLSKVNSEVRGIVWLTDKPLSEFPTHFNELDYLFDGLIAEHVDKYPHQSNGIEKNIFVGQSFNRDLILIQLCSNDKSMIEKELEQLLKLVPGKGEHAHVLMIGEHAKTISTNQFKKKLDLRFELL